MMKITAAIPGRRRSGVKDVSMTTFFLQDRTTILEYTIRDGLREYA
jgi:hypothetical protein